MGTKRSGSTSSLEQAFHDIENKSFGYVMLIPRLFCADPPKTAEMFSKYRETHELVKRVKDIDAELKSLGAVRELGRPVVPSTFMDRSWFAEQIPKWKQARAEGRALDHHAFMPLRHHKMVDRPSLQSRLDALYNEECDALIRLREFQLELDFEKNLIPRRVCSV